MLDTLLSLGGQPKRRGTRNWELERIGLRVGSLLLPAFYVACRLHGVQSIETGLSSNLFQALCIQLYQPLALAGAGWAARRRAVHYALREPAELAVGELLPPARILRPEKLTLRTFAFHADLLRCFGIGHKCT